MGRSEGGIGSDGGAIRRFGAAVGRSRVVCPQRLQGETQIVKNLRVSGSFGVELGKNLQGCGQVTGGKRVVRLLDQCG
jgi:hypothetical protein